MAQSELVSVLGGARNSVFSLFAARAFRGRFACGAV